MAAMPLTKRQADLLRIQARIDQMLAEVKSIAADLALSPQRRSFLTWHLRLNQGALRRIERLIGETERAAEA
jgi:hypothetical protein